MANQAWGYAFASDHGVDAMAPILNGEGPWTWELRDSSHYGDYLNSRPADGCRLRIHDARQFLGTLRGGAGDQRPYRITVEIGPAALPAREPLDGAVRELLTRLGAREVVACDPID
jgi:hypothetical protein